MSQRMCLLHLKMQKMFFKFVPSLLINFWWCAVDCGLTVWVHLSHDRYLERDRVGISAAEVTVMIETATGLSQKLNSELSCAEREAERC